MSDSLFIDVGNLNTLFKVGGTFCLGVNYASCPGQLVIDAQALGSSFDIFLSMWPRVPKEGDVEIQSLSVGGIPFVALQEEVESVISLVEKIPGVKQVYLCNALANFIIPARVNNFNTVLCYGSRYALVEVKDKTLATMQVYNTQLEFFKDKSEDFCCYGDLDLVDIDKIRSQYPEFTELKSNVIVPLVPLIMSYRSTYKVTIEEARQQMETGRIVRVRQEPVKVPPVRYEVPDYDNERKPKKERRVNVHNVDWVTVGAGFLCGVFMLVSGIGYALRDVSSRINTYSNDQMQYELQGETYTVLQSVYNAGYETASKAATLLNYIYSSEIPVQVTASEIYYDRQMVRFSCMDAEVKDRLVAYLEQKYIVSEVNEWGTSVDVDQNVIREYGVTVVL